MSHGLKMQPLMACRRITPSPNRPSFTPEGDSQISQRFSKARQKKKLLIIDVTTASFPTLSIIIVLPVHHRVAYGWGEDLIVSVQTQSFSHVARNDSSIISTPLCWDRDKSRLLSTAGTFPGFPCRRVSSPTWFVRPLQIDNQHKPRLVAKTPLWVCWVATHHESPAR